MNKQAIEKIYINFSLPINVQTANQLKGICVNLLGRHDPKELHFHISSPGGSVRDGIDLYNFLKALPCNIIMHNMGVIDSIATVIFMAGNEKYACPGTSFLFHGVGIQVPERMNYSKLQEIGSGLKVDEDKIAHLLAENCDLSEDEIKQFFSQGESKDLDFALDKKIIDEIKPAVIDKQFPIVHINMNIK